ncbi:hypothetical protein [Streptomyces zaomyceticus]|uniref:hypothetical protein n=1 Tax=Streptomyces zaomyceticus TaxID=68286 RepID=UPI0033A8020C
MALRQTTIASQFLGGVKDKQRILALEVILGLWSEALADLEKNASEAESQHRAAQAALTQFKRLRDSGALTNPSETRREYDQRQTEHKAAAERAQTDNAALSTAIGEHGRLVALHKAAEQQRRRTAKQAEDARVRLNRTTADLARAEGVLSGLLSTPEVECCANPRILPGRCVEGRAGSVTPHRVILRAWADSRLRAETGPEAEQAAMAALEDRWGVPRVHVTDVSALTPPMFTSGDGWPSPGAWADAECSERWRSFVRSSCVKLEHAFEEIRPEGSGDQLLLVNGWPLTASADRDLAFLSGSVAHVGGGDGHQQDQTEGIDDDVPLRPLICLPPSKPRVAAPAVSAALIDCAQ